MGTEHPSQMEDLFDRLDAVELPPLGHAVPAAVLIDAIVAMPTGGFCAEVRTESFAEAKQLPKVLLIDGCLYGLTGWSPDRSVASYKTTVCSAGR
jgi:hypothetical protein